MEAAHPPRLILVSGIMASGKTTVAQRLAERFPCSVHLHGDTFRTSIVNGRVERGVPLADEALRQIELRYRISADVAAHYLAAGFTVVYQDVIIGEPLRDVARSLVSHRLHVVVLCPRADVVAARDAERDKDAYDTVESEHFDRVLRHGTPRIGLWIDTSDLEVDATVERVLGGLDAARVRADDLE